VFILVLHLGAFNRAQNALTQATFLASPGNSFFMTCGPKETVALSKG
jgi:hypothetical protein